jgi:uncharacterized MnhB-related membrane protein
MNFNLINRGTVEMKLFLFLWGASFVGHILIIPYLYSLQFENLSAANISPLAFDFMSILQGALLGAGFAFLGVNISRRSGLGFVLLEKHLAGSNQKENLVTLVKQAFLGSLLLVAVFIALMVLLGQEIRFDFSKFNAGLVFSAAAGAYDGLLEEIILRLIIFSGLFFIFRRFGELTAGWLAFIFSIFLTVLGQVFVAANIAATEVSLSAVLVVSLFFSFIYNYLFWRKGFETSALVHSMTNILLQGAIPIIFTRGIPI